MRITAVLLTLLAGYPGTSFAEDFKTYWGRDLYWSSVATVPGAVSLHHGPSAEDAVSDIDVLTEDGRVVRLTKDRGRLAYTSREIYSAGDAVQYSGQGDGGLILTRDGKVLLETGGKWKEMGNFPGARRARKHAGIVFVQVGAMEIVRIPGPGLTETLYRSNVEILSFEPSPVGVFFSAQGGLYFVPRAGEAHHILDGEPRDWVKLVYGSQNNGGEADVGGKFVQAGLSSPPYVEGWLYLVKKSGDVTYVDWNGSERPLATHVGTFHGYSASDFNYYSYVADDGTIYRMDFGTRHLDKIRLPDPEIIDYTSSDVVHVVLDRSGEIQVADENNEGSRSDTGSRPLPLAKVAEQLLIQPWEVARLTVGHDRPQETWSLLEELLGTDRRSEVQPARLTLYQVLDVYDPETTYGIDHFEKYLRVRTQVLRLLKPLRDARGDLALDLHEDLRNADHYLDAGRIPEQVTGKYLALVDTIVDRMLVQVKDLRSQGARNLERGLNTYKIKRRMGVVDWRLSDTVEQLRSDREAGLWKEPATLAAE